MAERRMFAKKITESDAFLDLPHSTQNLYFHLNQNADDRGVVSSPRSVMRMCRASDDDAKLLLAKKFIISFENEGVVVIKHWKMHNFIAKDRFHESAYTELISCLYYDENSAYTLSETDKPVLPLTSCIQDSIQLVNKVETEVRSGKDSIGKDSSDKESIGYSLPTIPQTGGSQWCPGNLIPPDIDSVRAYVREKNLDVDADEFFGFYSECHWESKGDRVHNWMSLLQAWAKRNAKSKPFTPSMQYEPIDAEYMRGLMDRI